MTNSGRLIYASPDRRGYHALLLLNKNLGERELIFFGESKE